MADVSTELEKFRTASKGEEVRGALISSIQAINAEVTSDTNSARTYANNASSSASSAASSASSARTYATNAASSATDLNTAVKTAESWANGNNLNVNPQAEENNAYYYAAQAGEQANLAAIRADECATYTDAIVSGVSTFGPGPGSDSTLRTGRVTPVKGDYDTSMIVRTGSDTSLDNYLTQYDSAVEALDDIANFANVDIVTPVLKCFGIRGNIGATGLQSMCVVGDLIYTYGTAGKGTTLQGRFCVINPSAGTHSITSITNNVIDKGNGMCTDGTLLYLIGTGSGGNVLRSLASVPISNLETTPTVVQLTYPINGIAFKEKVNNVVYLYGYRQETTQLSFYTINASTGAQTLMFTTVFPEAQKFDQDMCYIDGYFYCVSDYHGAITKIDATTGELKKIIRLAEYADNGIFTGEFEGIDSYNGRILLASTFTDYLEDEQSEYTEFAIPTGTVETVALSRPRNIVLTTIDLNTNISPYSREMRGSLATQDIVRHINYSADTRGIWLPDGTTSSPYPTPGVAFSTYQNPRHRYTFVVDSPYTDSSTNKVPYMVIVNQKDVRIHLTSACANISLFIFNSRITLSAACDFKIAYLTNSTVDYMSEAGHCKSVKNYSAGNSRFNCPNGYFSSPFGDRYYTPRGNYAVRRAWGTDSNDATPIASNTVTFPCAGQFVSFRIRAVDSKGVYFGMAYANKAAGSTRAMMITSANTVGNALFTLNATTGMTYLAGVVPNGISSSNAQTTVCYALVEMNMS